MRRTATRWLFLLLSGAIGALGGGLTALLYSGVGRGVLAQAVAEYTPRLVRGAVTIGRISGTFTRSLVFHDLEIRDTAGALVASFERLGLTYRLSQFFRNRIVFDRVDAVAPDLRLAKRPNGRMNYEEVFRLGESAGGRSPLIELHQVRLTRGAVDVRAPWTLDADIRPAARDSALTAEFTRPGRALLPVPGQPGRYTRVRLFRRVEAQFDRLRIASPDGAPLLAAFDSLSAWISDPGIDLRYARGQVVTGGDSLVFRLDAARLPRTTAAGSGRLTWPQDTTLYDLHLTVDTLDLRDLHWITPKFPDYRGHAVVDGVSPSGMLTEFTIRDLHLQDDTARVDGSLTALVHRRRGLGFRDLDVVLHQVDVDEARRFVDSLPFYGRISGPLHGSGYLTALATRLDWTFVDHALPHQPRSALTLDGTLRLGGPDGLGFGQVLVPAADLDLGTVRRIAPAVRLEGRLGLAGLLDGPWRNATFLGTAEQRFFDLPPSVVQGEMRFDLRDTAVVVAVDADVKPLRFELLRLTFPGLTLQGEIDGHFRIQGTMAHLAAEGTVAGAIGAIAGGGLLRIAPDAVTADSLGLAFQRLDLAALRGDGRSTRLDGTLTAAGRVATAAEGTAPEGRAVLAITGGSVDNITLDSAVARLAVADSVITFDTVAVAWAGGGIAGAGSLGWAAPKTGQLRLNGASARLTAFDPLVDSLAGGAVPDTATAHHDLDGRVAGVAVVTGALDQYHGAAQLEMEDLRWHTLRAGAVRSVVNLLGNGGAQPGVDVVVAVDSLTIGRLHYPTIAASAQGTLDDVVWTMAPVDSLGREAFASGRWASTDTAQVVRVDSLRLRLSDAPRTWTLRHPATIVVSDKTIAVDSLDLRTAAGSGRIVVRGSPAAPDGNGLTVQGTGVPLQDAYALIQRDTAQVGGWLGFDVAMEGAFSAPVIRGTANLAGATAGDFQAPFARTAFFYDQQSLSANLSFWRAGQPIVSIDALLPIDLSLRAVGNRQLPGALAIRARTDSVDLGVLEAFTPNLRQVRGRLAADMTVDGTWAAPHLGGIVELRGGSARVPALGVAYGPIDGVLTLAGDSLVVDSLRIGSDQAGYLDVTGGMEFRRLTEPQLGLRLRSRRFAVMDVPDFLRLRGAADLRLTGTLAHPVLTGTGTVTNSVVYFADLVTKDIVNLDDPLNADLIDTAAVRRAGLRAAFQSRFLDSLRIERLTLGMTEDVWLRSNEANIQLEGSVQVQKERRTYRLNGELTTPRGTYALKIPPVVTRDFTVERGTVRYFGTPDLNADLDIQARHIVKSADPGAEDLAVVAHIEGTLRVPTLRLESDSRPPIPQGQLISLLVFGYSDVGAVTRQQGALQSASLTALASALSSEVQRSIVSSERAGAPDLIEIRPGAVFGGTLRGVNQIAAGWQVGRRWFVTLNAGFCFEQQSFDYRTFGASLEYRLSRDWRIQASAEPVQFCGTSRTVTFQDRSRYQFGGDIRWSRDY